MDDGDQSGSRSSAAAIVLGRRGGEQDVHDEPHDAIDEGNDAPRQPGSVLFVETLRDFEKRKADVKVMDFGQGLNMFKERTTNERLKLRETIRAVMRRWIGHAHTK
jgi:hypothetical protein